MAHQPSALDDATLRIQEAEATRTQEDPSPNPLPRTLPRGARVGDYILDRPLARGGFSFVYRATHAERGTAAALKVLHAELASDLDAVVRFAREIEAIQRLNHPNVVAILDHGRLGSRGAPYYVMELLDGCSLDEHLRARGRLSATDVLALLEPLCSALDAAHRWGIVHRDIKASNVFLAEQGGRRRVVLLDFGVAKLLDAPGPALTSSRHIVGTPTCISPEQILGESIDSRADVYALGVLTYRMLVGEPPFVERSYPMLRQLHLYVDPPRPSTRARVHPALDEVILRAMSKDRRERPPTITAFLGELRATVEASGGTGALSSAAARERQALALYAEVHVEPSALEEPEDGLLADLEVILPFIAAELVSAGLTTMVQTGSSMLFTVDRPDDPAGDREARRQVVRTALAIYQRLEARSGRDPRVDVRLCLHAGELTDTGKGSPAAGKLLEVAGWVPDQAGEGVFASPELLSDLEIATAGEEGALRRITAPRTREG
ncbi:serine/threonine-protein kinase [Sorangium atrum]|uniref:Serine/threonine-protein kinase n=1 Tax=Sorangium atrum TaxID=2995308 RepID=A0ABT5C165_9BACT|nr:serine/threonine-protein kinase [Sorangium aterium]MDC0679499.1 serine/threonine-protein kinase [Sorangium aterium]